MKILLAILGVLLAGGVALSGYMGLFRKILVEEREEGPFTLVYQELDSVDMRRVGEITTALNDLLAKHEIERRKPLDVFFPDGRSEIGFAVEGAAPDRLAALSGGAKVREIPARRCMVTRFPWRNTMSFMAGYFKVDPALARHREARGYEKVEAYALNEGDTILYMQPIVPR